MCRYFQQKIFQHPTLVPVRRAVRGQQWRGALHGGAHAALPGRRRRGPRQHHQQQPGGGGARRQGVTHHRPRPQLQQEPSFRLY